MKGLVTTTCIVLFVNGLVARAIGSWLDAALGVVLFAGLVALAGLIAIVWNSVTDQDLGDPWERRL